MKILIMINMKVSVSLSENIKYILKTKTCLYRFMCVRGTRGYIQYEFGILYIITQKVL